MRCRDFLVFLVLTANACAVPARPPPLREPAPPAPAVAPPASPPPAASSPGVAKAAQTLQLVPLPPTPAPNPSPVVEIKFPILGQVIASAKAAEYKVRLKVENWPLAARGAGVEIALDQQAPRRVLTPEPIRLDSVGGELTPGEHLLVVWAIRETGEVVRPAPGSSRAPFAAVSFSIGDGRGQGSAAASPVLRYVSPTGTINGDRASDALLVDFLPLFANISPEAPVHVKIQADGAGAPGWTAELVQPVWAPVGVRGLPNGDWKISLEQGANRAAQVITVNRDLVPALVP